MTSYSIFWDFSTTPLWSDFPLMDLVLNWEDKFYPGTKPVRRDCVIFLDSSSESSESEASIGTLGSSLKDCGFKLIEYTYRQSNAEVVRRSQQYLKKSEVTDLIFISGKRDFFLKIYYASQMSSTKFNLITADKYVKKFEWANKVLMFDEVVLDTLDKISETDHDDPWNIKSLDNKENVEKEANKEDIKSNEDVKSKDDGKDVNKPDESSSWSTPPTSSTKPTSKKTEVSPEKFERDDENKKLRFMCLLSFDFERRNELMNTLESCLEAFKGRITTCWNGVCVLEFRSKFHLANAEPFLSSLHPICGLQMNSITVLDKVTGETLDLIPGEKVSNQTYKKKSTEKVSAFRKGATKNAESYPDKDQVSKSDGNENNIGNKIWAATPKPKPNTNSSSRDDDPQKPRGWEFLKNGYFLTFTDLMKEERPAWYRSQILKLLGDIQAKFIYFDPKTDWAMIEFNTEDDRNAAQKVLRGVKFPGKSVVLNPDRTSTISSYHINRIKFFYKFYNFTKNTITEKRVDDEFPGF